MTDQLTCPFCQQAIPHDAKVCDHCGKPLGLETTIWTTAATRHDIQQPPARTSEFEAGTVYLYVAGAQDQKPIRHQGGQPVVLGRSADAPSSNPLIDLSQYHAFSLGVSRQHALIGYSENGYTIEDLGSSNGTWLNGNRLTARQPYPLRSGDHVQLGELLIFVYFV